MSFKIENLLGFSALILYILTLTPSILRVILPSFRNKFVIFLTKYRRRIGVSAWIFGFLHGSYIVFSRNLNLLDPKVALNYTQGILLLTIFTILAATSNNFSVKLLKRNWKNLHRLTYLVLIILPWHILDKMHYGWSVFTPIGISLLAIVIFFFLERWYLVWRKDSDKKLG